MYIRFTHVFVLLYQSVVSGIGCNLLNHFDVIVEYIYGCPTTYEDVLLQGFTGIHTL